MRLNRPAAWLVLLTCPWLAQADINTPRVFDIVPPEGREVQWVDGYTVLRQPGEKFGAVVSFIPESGLTAWVPVAVLNTSGKPLKVKQKDIRAHYGESPLKVYDNKGLVHDATRRRREMLAYSQHDAEGKTLDDLVAPNRSLADGLREGDQRGNVSDSRGSRGSRVGDTSRQDGSSDAREAQRLADAQLEALKERLFRDTEIEPGRFSRGEVRITLPPRRDDAPTEFVLTLDFGGEQMPILFRERDGSRVDVGEPVSPDAPETSEG